MRFERLGAFEYSHEENTGAFALEDDVPAEVKFRRVNEIMEVQSQISWEINQQKVGKHFVVYLIEKKAITFMDGQSLIRPMWTMTFL